MPSVTPVDAAPEMVLGITQAVPLMLGGYAERGVAQTQEAAPNPIGPEFMQAAGRIIANLTQFDFSPKKPATLNDAPYENNAGLQFRRMTERTKQKRIRDYVRFILPETTTSDFRVVHIDYDRAEHDALSNPTKIADKDATLAMEFFRHKGIHHPEVTFSFGSSQSVPVISDERQPDIEIISLADQMANTLQIIEAASERSFTRIEGQPDLVLTGGFREVRATRDPYDPTKGVLQAIGMAAASTVGIVWNGTQNKRV